MLVGFDAAAPGSVFAWTADGDKRKPIGRLEANERIDASATGEDVREKIAEVKRDQAIMHKATRAAAKRTRTAVQRVNEEQRAKRVELLATGTDDHRPDIHIVQTGFEGVSRAVRGGFDSASYTPPELDTDDLFGPESNDDDGSAVDGSADLDDLLESEEEADDGAGTDALDAEL